MNLERTVRPKSRGAEVKSRPGLATKKKIAMRGLDPDLENEDLVEEEAYALFRGAFEIFMVHGLVQGFYMGQGFCVGLLARCAGRWQADSRLNTTWTE